MLNVTRAVFCHSDSVQTTPLYQWDYGQILLFEGIDLPANFEVNFSNTPMSGSSLTVFGTDNQVNIPSSLLETGKDIWCWVFLHDTEADGETKYTVTIPVIARAMRDGTEPTPEQQDAIGTAIEALNDATEVLEEATTQTEGYRDQAEAFATQAESWAVGGTDTRQGEDTNNAKYYAEQTAQTAEAAIQDIQTEGAVQIGAIEAKGNAVKESIPDEYSEFYDEFVVNRARVFGEIFAMSGAITERVEDGTLLKNQIMANKICSSVGYCFDADEGKIRVFGIFGSFPPTGGTNRSYNLFCFDSPDAPYELTLENAPLVSQMSGAVDVYKVRTNATIPGPNVTDHFDHRYCRVLYDKDGNEVERHYSAQYRYTLNNGVATRSRLMTEPQDPDLIIDIGLYTCTNTVPQTFTWAKQDRIKAVLKPLVSTNQTAQYNFIVPDALFTGQYGLAITAVGGDWVEYVGAQFFPAPIPPDPLPSVTSSDNGKVLKVVDGEWDKAEEQVDDTLTIQGIPADAKATGDAIASVRSSVASEVSNWLDEHVDPATGYVIDNTLSVGNSAADSKITGSVTSGDRVLAYNKHNLIPYGFEEDCKLDPTNSTTSATNIGVVRHKDLVILNTNVASNKTTKVKLNGSVVRTADNPTVDAWQGISLSDGHIYRVSALYVSGESSIVTLPISVYKQGTHTTTGSASQDDNHGYFRTFIYDGTPVNIAVVCSAGVTYNNFTFKIVLEDLTDDDTTEDATVINTKDKYRFCQGGFARAGTQLSTNYAKYYLITGDYIQPNVYKVSTVDGYKITCFAWNKSDFSYAGFLDGEAHFTTTTTNTVYWSSSIDFVALRKTYPDCLFRVELANNSTASGTNSNLYPDDGDAVIFSEVQGAEIRDYYEAEMTKTIAETQNAITEPALVFPVVTDIHFASESNLSTLFNAFLENFRYFAKRIKCDFVANLGDCTDGDRVKTITMDRCKYMLRGFVEPFEYLCTIGNHDTNYYAPGSGVSLALSDYFPTYMANTKHAHFDTISTAPLNCYVDFDEIGVRVLQIDSSYGGRYTYSNKLAQWLTEDALVTDKTVLLLSHLSPISTQNWEARQMVNYSGILSALTNFANTGTLIQLCGHSHADYYFSSPWLSVFNGCQKLEQVDVSTSGYQAITGYQGSIVSPARSRRNATEDLWSVCVLKPLSGELDVIRFGAGTNRYFHYKATSVSGTVTLSSVLTDTLTWTTSDATVATVSGGTVTAVASGSCQITATDASGNFETWTVSVA